MQQTAIDGCTHADGSLELEKIIFFQAVVGINPIHFHKSPFVGKL